MHKFNKKLDFLYSQYDTNVVDYDKIYDFLEGWMAYAKNANTYKLRKELLEPIEQKFIGELSTKEINRYAKKQQN